MDKILRSAACILVALATASSVQVRFDNCTLFRVQPRTETHLVVLEALRAGEGLSFWNEPVSVKTFVNIVTQPDKRTEFEDVLIENEIEYIAAIDNIQDAIDNEKTSTYTSRNLRTMQWDAYYPLDYIYQWLDDLATAYPNVVTPLMGGTTYEGREIRGVKISYGIGRRAIFIEGGIHAVEWVVPATVTYIINELLHSTDGETRSAAEGYDWYIFPVFNPDGYVYTFESDRMWRKNRRPVGDQYGVDLNRNWNNNWLSAGADTDPSSEFYAGTGPFSEFETRTLSSFINGVADQLDMYLGFHSYSQLLMVPYGNTTDHLDNYWDAVTIARRAVGSLSVRHGTQYVVGNIAETIYLASGNSLDWVKATHRVPLAFVYELRDDGYYGFLLPAEQILPNCEETMDSVLALIREAKYLGYLNSGSKSQCSLLLPIIAMISLLLKS